MKLNFKTYYTYLLDKIICINRKIIRQNIKNGITNVAIAEHSECQPGLPDPMEVSQNGSPSFDRFHKAKSGIDLLRDNTS